MVLLALACADGTSDDSGPVEVAAELVEEGRIVCSDPGLRETEGPMYRAELGDAWTDQLVAGDPVRRDAIGLTVDDIDGDGRWDIVLLNKGPSFVFQLDADGTMTDKSELLPDQRRHEFLGGVSVDHDGDGDPDVLAYGVGYDLLYRNDGGRLVDVAGTETDFSEDDMPTKAGSCGDLDGDGDMDCLLGTETSTRQSERNPPDPGWPSIVAENVDGVLETRLNVLSDEANYSYAFMHTLVDLDDDGDLDLYNVNAFGHRMWGNRVLMNVSDGDGIAFEDVSEGHPLSQAMDGMGLGLGDVNGDELPDLLVTDWGRIFLYESVGGGDYIDVTAVRGLTLVPDQDDREIAWGAELVDLDNDRDLDLPILFGRSLRGATIGKEQIWDQPDGLWIQDESGQFVESSAEWDFDQDLGPGRGFAAIDLNDDGYLDIVKRAIEEPALLYLSRCGADHWLKVRLAHHAPNTQGVGARVRVTSDQGSQIRWVVAGGTSMAYGGPNEVHFGLGSDEVVDIDVLWADGAVSRVEGVDADQRVWVLREGQTWK